jgi:3-deoxy-7-phosphoheptulonate synthase
MATTSDLHVVETRPLVAPALLHQDLAPDATALNTVTSARKRIQAILRGDDQRFAGGGGSVFGSRCCRGA